MTSASLNTSAQSAALSLTESNPLKTGPWYLSDLKTVIPNGLKVFSCFHCGGGSTMGYKLAGCDVIGGVEIDPQMMRLYRTNHNPKHSYLMGVQEFKNIPDRKLPRELFNLDILDGSPPCSSFSVSGSREKAWGKSKKFREGQAEQILDDLFFDFIDIAAKLKPKVVIAENVKGLILGNARGYVKQIFTGFKKAGYDCQLFLLNAAAMGVPQRRERVFFIARRRDLQLPALALAFSEKPITVQAAFEGVSAWGKCMQHSMHFDLWKKTKPGDNFASVHSTGSCFNWVKLNPFKPAPVISGNSHVIFHWETMRQLSMREFCRLQSFPDDYDFQDVKPGYVCGMSVPPFMMQRVADQVIKQWFSAEGF